MVKTSDGIVKILLSVLVLIAISIACNLPGNGRKNLTLNPRAEDGSVSGSYSSGSSDDKVNFSVTKNGFATFHLEGSSESAALTVDLSDEQTASMDWNETTLDGIGALTDNQQSVLDDLMSSNIAHSLELIPIDIACQGDDEIDPKQAAALLVPLQMRFKYLITDRVAESQKLIALSQCGYGGVDEQESLIILSRAAPVPVVFGYFPFDAEGAVEPPKTSEEGLKTACLAVPPALTDDGLDRFNLLGSNPDNINALRTNETGPCDALCRGACGADCEPNNCKTSKELRCEVDEEGNNTGMEVQYQIHDCGMHKGCIDHDICYDQCNETYGCKTWLAAACRHEWSLTVELFLAAKDITWWCDQQAISDHGTVNPPLWAKGFGPQPIRETFEYLDEEYEKRWNPEKCPEKVETDSSPSTDKGEKIPVGIYNGSVKVEGWFFVNDRTPITEIIFNNVRIKVADDGTVSGTLKLIFDAEFTTRKGSIVYISEVFLGTFSGQLTGASGTIDLKLENQTESTGSDGDASGEDTLDFIADVQISGENMTGSVGPNPNDYYFFFDAIRE